MGKSVFLSGTAAKGKSGKGTCPTLEDALINLGYEISNTPDADFLICLNHNHSAFRKFMNTGGNQGKTYLVLLEPESVYPSQYSRKNLKKYQRKITPGSPRFNSVGDEFIGWPYTFNVDPSQPKETDGTVRSYLSSIEGKNIYDYESWIGRKSICTLIAANKVSPTKRNQYSLRRYFAKNLSPSVLEIYGPLWTDPIYRKIWVRIKTVLASLKWMHLPNLISSYGNLFWRYPGAKGVVENKHLVLLDSKFSIVIENSADYVSEKLFDAIINGSIPFYFGPELKSVGLPSGIAIPDIKTTEDINRYLENLKSEDIIKLLSNMKSFVNSNVFKDQWNYDVVYRRIAEDFHEKVGKYE